jgi:hypothetical protein
MVLVVLFPMLDALYFYINIFWSMCAVPNMAVLCRSLMSYFPICCSGVLLLLLLLLFNPHSSLHSSLSGSQKSRVLTDQALLIHCSAKVFIPIWHVSSIAAVCFGMYRPGRRLSSFKLSCYVFVILPLLLLLLLLLLLFCSYMGPTTSWKFWHTRY